MRPGFCMLFAVCGIVYGGLRHYVNRFPQNRVLQNVYIGTLDVSGMKEKEARQAVDAHHQEHLGNMVTMGVGEKSAKASLGELGLKYKDADQLVKQAMNYGKKGSVVQRFREIRGLSKEKHVVKEAMRLDPETAKAVIDERAVPLTVRAENAYIERTGEGSFSVVEEKEGYTVDVEASIESLEQFIEKTGTMRICQLILHWSRRNQRSRRQILRPSKMSSEAFLRMPGAETGGRT